MKNSRITASRRPVFLNLTQIQMPVGALTSIGHRLTGVLLAVSVPLCVYLVDRSLQGQQGFEQVRALLDHGVFKIVVILMIWALAHHLLAGVRHLLTDFNVGSTLLSARRSAWGVNVAGAAVALLAAAVLL